MKLQCSCGAKSEIEITPEMASHPVRFVCPACGLDASDFVEGLVRRELGQAASPTGTPVWARAGTPAAPMGVLLDAPSPAPPSASTVSAPAHTPDPGLAETAPLCLKHPGQVATQKCHVCGKLLCPKCMELFGYVCSPLCRAKANSHGLTIPVYEGQKSVVEARFWRKVTRLSLAGGAFLLALLGFWFWYAWFGCLPKPVFSTRFAEPAYAGQSVTTGPQQDQLLFLHGGTLARHDLKRKQQIWSRELLDHKQIAAAVEQELQALQKHIQELREQDALVLPRIPSADKLRRQMEQAAAEALSLHVRGQNVWVASPGKLTRYDWETGQPVKELAVREGYGGVLSRGDELLVVDAGTDKVTITHINLARGELSTEELGAAGSPASAQAGTNAPSSTARASGGSDLAGLPIGTPGRDLGKAMDPAKVAEQAQHMSLPARLALPALLAGNMSQERLLAELNDNGAPSSNARQAAPAAASSSVSLVPCRDGFVLMAVRLLESRIVEHSAMKPAPAKSALDGNLTAAQSEEVANEILNEMQRSRGGDLVREDLSRYRVTLRQPGAPDGWSGEVTGPPRLYPLPTVNVLAANKTLLVLDKSYKKLWQAVLAFEVEGRPGALDEETATYGQGPCVEHKGSLYVIDQGVLSAFDLATGNARWRLPSVGITGLFFDDQEMIYVNTTTASHESLKYSRQIDVSQKVKSVVLKVDSRNGKLLWSAAPGGLVNYVSGKFIFAVQSYMPPEEEDDGPFDNGSSIPPYLRIRRINPKNGEELWQHFQQRAPLDIAFDKNTIRLVFKKEVQVLKVPSF